MSFNLKYMNGATNHQLKHSLHYSPYLKLEDEIEGIRTLSVWEPALLSASEEKGNTIAEDGAADSHRVHDERQLGTAAVGNQHKLQH